MNADMNNLESIRAIDELRESWHHFFNEKRIEELCDTFYTEDTVLIPPDHAIIQGRDLTGKYFQELVDLGDVRFKLEPGIKTIANDRIGYGYGKYIFYDNTGDVATHAEGRTLETYVREADGTWKCSIDMWHDLENSVIESPLSP